MGLGDERPRAMSGTAAMSGRHATVVGGGLAGIAAALELARAGASVTLMESRGRLGGAAYSFSREGLMADNGQHVFLRCCTAYRELVEELGAGDGVALQDRLEIAVLAPGRRRAWLRRSGLPAPLHLAGSLLRYPFLGLRGRVGVARAMQGLAGVDVDDPAADARSFGDWLREAGQSGAAVEAIWELIARPTLNLRVQDASLAQAAQVFQVGLLSDCASGDIGHARVPLGQIHDVAAQAALRRAGVSVRLRCGATRVTADAEGGRFSVEAHGGAAAVVCDMVVLAVPPDRAVRLTPAQAGIDPRIAERLGGSPIVNLHVVYDRPVLDVEFAAGVGTPVQWVFDRTQSAGVSEGQYLVVSLSAADEELGMSRPDLEARYLPALADLLPAAGSAGVLKFFVTRDHAATFRAAPGARAWRPGPRTALPGLALAGAWTDTGWPATMEGAVRSGRAAALEVSRPAVEASVDGLAVSRA